MLSSRENLLPYPSRPLTVDRRWKPNVELAPNCPRCDSSNTKFCYYNNYSLSQPRYFCKGCRRYWTKGGSLRNVPVGGGCRKNRRGKPLRLPTDPSSAGRELHSCSRPIPGSVRPDLALDGMVGNSTSCQPTAADGSTIDLAMLYAKFLNPCAELDGDGVAPRYAGGIDEPLEAFGDHQIPVSLPDNDGFMECNGEVNFSMDSSFGYESLAYPIESNINNLFSSNCSLGVPTLTTWDATKSSEQSFESIPEDSMALHQNIIASDWSALDCSALEAFYRS